MDIIHNKFLFNTNYWNIFIIHHFFIIIFAAYNKKSYFCSKIDIFNFKKVFMRKITSFLLTLLVLMTAVPAMAQLDELKDKVLSVGSAATQIEAGKWYVMKNGGRKAYAYSQGLGKSMMAISANDVTLSGADATDVAGYMVRFATVDGVENAYTIQTGLGDYWSELTEGSNNGTVSSDAKYFVASKIGNNDDWFCFMGNSGEMVLDCNAPGGTVAGWGTTLPTSTSSNAAWQIMSLDFVDASELLTATINYIYKMNGEIVYTYTKTQRGVKPSFTVTFDAPKTFVGATSTDVQHADEVISENKTIEVVYNYTVDTNSLPFTATTITGEGKEANFADGTKWYYLQPYNTKYYCYSGGEEDDYILYKTNDTKLVDTYAFFTFVGNPIQGYKIYNYGKGASLSFDATVVNENSSYVAFVDNGANYVIEEGTNDGQFRLRYAENSDSYINGYSNYLTLYTYPGWSDSDEFSQFYITEVSEETIARAVAGVLHIQDSNITPANNSKYLSGETLGKVSLLFDNESIVLPAESDRKTITFVDANGEVVVTPTYAIGEEGELAVTFSPEFSTVGAYTLIIPEGTVLGATSGVPNTEIHLHYTFMADFTEKTVYARVYKSKGSRSNWPSLPYEDGKDYYTTTVKVSALDEFTLFDWEGNGDETNNLNFTFDNNQTSYNGLTLNGTDGSGQTYLWTSTKTVVDDGYYGTYIYPGYSDFTQTKEYGSMSVCCYSFETNDYYYIIADWYMDDRYNPATPMLYGKVWNKGIEGSDFANDPAWTQLPYNKDGYYNIEVKVNAENSLTLYNYTGAEGENKTIEFDPATGNVTKIDGKEADEYGAVLCQSSVLDGVYGSYYEYLGDYSHVEYNTETQSGYAVLMGYDYSVGGNGDYRFLFVTFDTTAPDSDSDSETETIAARVMKSTTVDGSSYTNWSTLPYESGKDYYEVKVEIPEEGKVTVKDWDGQSGDNMSITYDPESGKVSAIEQAVYSDGYYWLDTKLDIDNYPSYPGCYVYPSYSTANVSADKGQILICCYSYTTDGNPYIIIEWGSQSDGINAVAKTNKVENIYNLAGQKLSKLQKGVNIIGGKKIIVK